MKFMPIHTVQRQAVKVDGAAERFNHIMLVVGQQE
jgi:hypothetical protein